MKLNIRLIYLYLFSFVGLLVVVIGLIRMVDLGLKTFVFKDADRYEYYDAKLIDDSNVKISTEEAKLQKEEMRRDNELNTQRQRQREFSSSLAMILIGSPLYFYHWKLVQKENN